MSLRHAILGLLSVEPMTGYDLLDYFDISAAPFWPAAQPQIYPELRRMEHDGLLSATVAPRGKRGKKRIYSVTRQGHAELRRWAKEPVSYVPDRDPARFKVQFLDLADTQAARQFFEEHLRRYTAIARQAEDRRNAMLMRRGKVLQKRLAMRDPAEHDAIVEYRALGLEGQVTHAKAEIAWAERGLAVVERLEKRGQTTQRRAAARIPKAGAR